MRLAKIGKATGTWTSPLNSAWFARASTLQDEGCKNAVPGCICARSRSLKFSNGFADLMLAACFRVLLRWSDSLRWSTVLKLGS
eukprot:2388800-Rhodomonas_salina.1